MEKLRISTGEPDFQSNIFFFIKSLKGIVSRKFAMLLLVFLESWKYSTPFIVNTFLKI
jgi:hypothetical protein